MSDKPMRAPHFHEMNSDQKIERLANELVRCEKVVEVLANAVSNLLEHQHSEQGKILVPMSKPNQENYGAINIKVFNPNEGK
jgi:hypothetical protein